MSPRAVLALCALALGATAFSPIPEMESEMETDAWSLATRDPSFRLPTTTLPRHYDITIEPTLDIIPGDDDDNEEDEGDTEEDDGDTEEDEGDTGEDDEDDVKPFTFLGTAVISVSVNPQQQEEVSEMVMHCNDLTINTVSVTTTVDGQTTPVPTDGVIPTCDPHYDFLRIGFLQPLNQNQEYDVTITYTGNIQLTMRGFYRSWYYDSTETKRWMATTQFQPGHARQAFPCYDEPGFKATFVITIIRETSFSPSISNMPIDHTKTVVIPERSKTSETFYPTPVMSTYLIAFIVSHYTVAETTPADDPRPFQIIARDNIAETGAWAYEVGVALLEYMEDYTGIEYYTIANNNMDMKQVAIPDFSAGAMENWGLLTYREALILYDPDNSNHFYRQRVANIVAHEIAHMWFGNLVTCHWWDVLWLNEGFARFYQYFLTGAVRPELGFEERFIPEQVHMSLLSDSWDSAHALSNPNVNTPAQVSSHFSTITYAKGAAVIRMTQHLLGDATFRKALRTYLRDREFKTASPEDLFNALDNAAFEDQALAGYRGIFIENYLKSWSEQAGHPMLTVGVNHRTGRITVTQARWEVNTGISSSPSLWPIPITWTRQNSIDFENTKPSQIITEQATIIDRGSVGHEWVIFNKQQTGFYRVNYDETTWNLITLALRSNERTEIHEHNRAQIVDDVCQLARAGVMNYTRAFNILSFLEKETDYAPWISAITCYNFIRGRVPHVGSNLNSLREHIIQQSTAIKEYLGFAERPTDTYMISLLRMYVMTFLCNIGDEDCSAAAVTNFQGLRATPSVPVPPNMRPWVYCGGLRAGNAEDFNFLWNHYQNNELAGEAVVLLESLGCTRDPVSLRFYLDQLTSDNDNIRSQDYGTGLNSAINSNEENTQIAFNWVQVPANAQQAIDELGSLSGILERVAARLRTDEQIVEFEAWLASNPTLPGINSGVTGATAARNNLVWSENRWPELYEYLQNGYQDVDIDDESSEESDEEPDEESDEESDEGSDEDADPGSANIAGVGFATLLITLFVNLINY